MTIPAEQCLINFVRLSLMMQHSVQPDFEKTVGITRLQLSGNMTCFDSRPSTSSQETPAIVGLIPVLTNHT